MSLTVAVQMDPLDIINIDSDTTFALALEAQRRGYTLYHYLPRHLSLDRGQVLARARPMTLRREKGNHYDLGDYQLIDLATMDVVLMRQEPPFDMAYITATHILEHIHPKTLVVNNPVSVRNAPEKLLVTHFPDLMPPTLITADQDAIAEFRAEYGDIVIKPLYAYGGAGVFRVKPDDVNLTALLEMFTQLYREPLMIQPYIPEVMQGDKRIILIDGKASGAVNRTPMAGEIRSNMRVGGVPQKTVLTKREHEICEALEPTLRGQGLILVGIDVIGDYLTEINVTCPTGIQAINRLDDVTLENDVWEAILSKL